MTAAAYTLRPAAPDDEAFLYHLFVSARPDAHLLASLPAAEREPFLRSQFALQAHHYTTHFPDAEHAIVLVDGAPVGRSWVDWRETEARWLDVALLPEHRGGGLGARLLDDLKAEAARRGIPVTLNVEHNNVAAKRFYARHGFRLVEDIGTHEFLKWTPGPAEAKRR
ncbi:MAG: GNAT family N-acetyltransferase [Planctomycetota bacterium]|nr:GNAT family N-acetyltransferase [Planctomycetota bacterium]